MSNIVFNDNEPEKILLTEKSTSRYLYRISIILGIVSLILMMTLFFTGSALVIAPIGIIFSIVAFIKMRKSSKNWNEWFFAICGFLLNAYVIISILIFMYGGVNEYVAVKNAVENNNVSYCDKINVSMDEGDSIEHARSNCIGYFNKVKSQIDSGSSECGHDAICLTAMALFDTGTYHSQDPRFPNFCMAAGISDTPPNNNLAHCVAVVAHNSNDISICDLLSEAGYSSAINQCKSIYSNPTQ